MYKEFETKTSFKYLKQVIDNLDEPICILGGWAVFFHVNKEFEKRQGRPYLGSRDIDLGFNLSDELVLKKAIEKLKKLNFKPLSFRLFKEIHTETEEELKNGNKVPTHFIFPMYVDLIVNKITDDFNKKFGFNPIDEPLLNEVFEKNNFTIIKGFNKKLLLPNIETLIRMKINSLPNRDKEHKKIKDLCDVFALLWYTNINIKKINKVKLLINEDDYYKVSLQLNHEKEEIKRILGLIFN